MRVRNREGFEGFVGEVDGPAVDGRRARGDRTRRAILDEAVQIASAEGLEGLSIGRLAEELGVSKSGLFAHFGSKVDLQVATVRAAREVFLDEVVGAARVGGGIQEIFSLTDAWLDYMEREVFRGGCFFVAASLEFDGRPGPVRDEVAGMVSEWLMALEAAIQDAQEAGHVSLDVDAQQLAFELHSLGMGANWAFQLYHDAQRSSARGRRSGGACQAPLRLEVEVDEGAARRTLRDQIARLERELATLFAAARPGDELDWQVRAPGGPRVLDIGDLEALRDDLADARRGDPARIARAGGRRGGEPRAARGDGRRTPPTTSGGASPTRTSESPVASTITRRRGSASSGC